MQAKFTRINNWGIILHVDYYFKISRKGFQGLEINIFKEFSPYVQTLPDKF